MTESTRNTLVAVGAMVLAFAFAALVIFGWSGCAHAPTTREASCADRYRAEAHACVDRERNPTRADAEQCVAEARKRAEACGGF